MANVFNDVSKVEKDALTQFSDEFKTALALGEVDAWSAQFAVTAQSDAIKTVYPLPVYAAGYQEFKGHAKFRSLYHRTITMRGREWQDGVQERSKIVNATDFSGWSEQPAAMALEAQRLPNTLTAEMLALNTFQGPALDLYRDADDTSADVTRYLFASDHPVNVLGQVSGTFSNIIPTQTSIGDTVLTLMKQHFRGLKGPNGKPLGLRMTHLVVPAALEQEAHKALNDDMIVEAIMNVAGDQNVGGVTLANRHKGTLTLVVGDELTSDGWIYGMAMNKPGLKPWIIQTTGAPVESVLGEDSEYHTLTQKVAISYFLDANVGAAFPHPICACLIT